MNDAEEVVGTSPAHRAAVWTRLGGLREIPLIEGFAHSEAVAVNARGEVAGVLYDAAFDRHRSFVFTGGRLILLPGEQARAYAINDSGIVVGESLPPGGRRTEPATWIDALLHPIPSCCGGTAKAVNAAGQVVGDSYDHEGRYHAFLWSAAAGARAIGPPDRYSSAAAVNARGEAVVQSLRWTYWYGAAGLTRLELSPRFPAHPRALNGCGILVGSFGPFSDKDRAFAWSASQGFLDLNTRLGESPGWKLEAAYGINDRGSIVGKGDVGGEQEVGFLLSPAPDLAAP